MLINVQHYTCEELMSMTGRFVPTEQLALFLSKCPNYVPNEIQFKATVHSLICANVEEVKEAGRISEIHAEYVKALANNECVESVHLRYTAAINSFKDTAVYYNKD